MGELAESVDSPPPPLPRPDRRPFTRWLTTRGGALVFTLSVVLVWFVFGQLIPACGIGLFAGFIGAVSGAKTTAADIPDKIAAAIPWITIWGAVVVGGMVLALTRLRWIPAPPTASGRPANSTLRSIVFTVAAFFACMGGHYFTALIEAPLGIRPEEPDVLAHAVAKGGTAIWIAIVLAAPIGEEFLFRRLALSALAGPWGRSVAVVVTSLLFASIHFNMSSFLHYVVIALACAYAYLRTGSVWAAIAVHAGNNAVAMWSAGQ